MLVNKQWNLRKFGILLFAVRSNLQPVCQYNEDCPPEKLCDRLNRLCINPCNEDSCGENAECVPDNHQIECKCLPGYFGNPYVECGLGKYLSWQLEASVSMCILRGVFSAVTGCRKDSDCATNEACINGKCGNPCRCGPNSACEVHNHVPICKCPPGYTGSAHEGCQGKNLFSQQDFFLVLCLNLCRV